MNSARHAVIDVGTNSVKLLVADVRSQEVAPVWEGSTQTRLGLGFYETHRLQPGPIAQTAGAVARFTRQAREHGALSVAVFATSAAREAVNPGDLIAAVEQASGLRLEIISGQQEAEWAFQGVTTDPALARDPVLLMEVGGGSTQLILGRSGQCHFLHSFQVGTVRLLEKIPHSDPPRLEELAQCRAWLREQFERDARENLEIALKHEALGASAQAPVQLVAVGGTASILARIEAGLSDFDRDKIEAVRLTSRRVREWTDQLWSMPLAERQLLPGLPANRADVMLNGIAVFEAVMEGFGFPSLRISTRGLRFAAVLNLTRR